MPLGRARTVTGLDVGTTSIKAVRLAHKRGGCRLLGLAVTDIAPPAGNASGGAKQKAPAPHDAAVSAIRAALEQSGASDERNAFVVTGMSGPGISVKHVSFPEMSTQRLAESLRWEARKHVPFSGSDFVMDFQPLPAASGADGEMQILLTAVDGAALSEHVELLGRAGVEPDTVDLVPLALMNELDEEGLLDGGALAVVDLGASIVSLAVYKRGGLFYARSVPVSAAARDSGDASGGARQNGGEAPDGVPHSDDSMSEGAAPGDDGWSEHALAEVRRSLSFYHNETGKQSIEKIYLAGGRALEPGISDAFSERLGIPTEVFNPLSSISDSAVELESVKPLGPRLAVAMGLARRI